MLQHIRERVKSGEYFTNADPEKRNILRIALANIGSPMWKCAETISDLCKFLYSLRALVRTTYAVCLLTVPWYLLKVCNFLENFLFLHLYSFLIHVITGQININMHVAKCVSK